MKNEQPEVWLEFPFFSRTKWYRACATRLEPPDFNQSFKVLVVHQDITRQKQAERKLQELSDRLSDSQKRERFSRVNNPITILIADDHTMILEAFKHMLEPEFEVVGTVTDGRALLTAAATLKPNVILLDISMPLLNGLDAGRRIKKLMPAVKLIYLTMDQDPNVAAEAFRVGASGYLLKNSAASELLHAIREGVKGRFYLTTLMTQGMAGSSFNNYHRSHKRSERLTARQREVVQLLAEGRSMKEVASLLNITTRTVAYHKYTVMEQHQIKTSAGLIQFAIKNHLLSV
ncbi:MAG: response regulator transcription factor [Blastocatellia bacterium]|nr:response regulator transcription factor [Blastocatellia bacterium]